MKRPVFVKFIVFRPY